MAGSRCALSYRWGDVATFVVLVSGGAGGASAAELGGRTARQSEWVRRLRDEGAITDGGRIEGNAVRVRAGRGAPVVVDVPRDALGEVRSWLLVHAEDLEEAVTLARSCPEAAYAELRVLPVDG